MSELDTNDTEFAVCPYCGQKEWDSWEIGDDNGSLVRDVMEHTCGVCDKIYEVSRHIEITYTTRPKAGVRG